MKESNMNKYKKVTLFRFWIKKQHHDMAVSVMCLFLAVPLIGLLCVIVKFPGYTHFHLFQVIK